MCVCVCVNILKNLSEFRNSVFLHHRTTKNPTLQIPALFHTHVARMGEEWGVYRVLLGKPEGKRPLGRPRRRWVDNIRTCLQEVGCGYMDWIELADACECGNEPSGSVKCGEFLD